MAETPEADVEIIKPADPEPVWLALKGNIGVVRDHLCVAENAIASRNAGAASEALTKAQNKLSLCISDSDRLRN